MRSCIVAVSLALVACSGTTADPWPAPPPPPPPPTLAPSPAPPASIARGPLASAPIFASTTRALVVGLLDFADPALTDFSPRDRRDVVVAETFAARGVPAENVTTLLDAQATREAVLAALASAAERTPPGGTLLVYYAGHGTRTPSGDVAYVAYDTRSGDAATTGLTVASLYATLAPRVVGKRVIFFADCCHSGALGALARDLAEGGVTAASVTSADASNTSTGNWTYSQVLLEGLRGDACLDADGDGSVAIAELDDAVKDAMRYRERQRSGAYLDAIDPSLVVAQRSGPARRGASAGRFMLEPGGEVVRVSSDDGVTAVVRGYDYAGYRDRSVRVDSLRPIQSTRYAVWTEMLVEWGAREWPAIVTATDGDFAFITYPGWPAYWDEWILSDRVRRVTRLGHVRSGPPAASRRSP